MLRYRAFWFGAWLFKLLPRRAAYAFASLAGEVSFALNVPARRVALLHMRRVLGPHAAPTVVRRAARGAMRAASAYYMDLARTPLMNPRHYSAHLVRDTGYHHISDALATRRGVILVSIHYGNPEYVAQCLSARGVQFVALVERVQPPCLFALFQRHRRSQGQDFVEVGVSGIRRAIRTLRAGGVVALIIDRDIQHNGVSVPFFGAPARIPSGAVDLALKTGAVILPFITHRIHLDEFAVRIAPPFALERTGKPEADRRLNTARLMQLFEVYIRADPSQWFVLEEPVWASTRGNANGPC